MIYAAQWLLQTHSSSATLRATQVVWTQVMATWDMWYIYEDFLVWIIPLTYLSRESIIWVCTTNFVHTCIYRIFSVFIACLMYLSNVYVYLCSRYRFLCMLSDSDLSIYMYLLDFGFTVVTLIFFMLLTCMREPPHLIMYTCDCLSTPTGFIICTRGVAFWQPWILMSRSWSLDHGGHTVPDQSGTARAWISSCLSGPSFFQPSYDRLARFSSCYSWVLSCISYCTSCFCASWWSYILEILYHALW